MKPKFHALPPNPTVEQVVELFRKLTGREPTEAEINAVKAQAVMQKGRVIQPDATSDNADWPKRTQDVKTLL